MKNDDEKTSIITGLAGKDRIRFFLLCFITALIPVLYPLIKGHGMYFIEDDFVRQQVPFITYLSGMIKQGFDTWSWDTDLGSSTIQAFSFYELGSPFFWLIALFPQRFAPYLIGWAMLLKYLTACYTSQMFLKRFVKDARYAVPGALMYAFSGFQCTNIVFNHFHDVTALFPLLLVGLEMVMDDSNPEKKTMHGLFFTAAVFLNSCVNYFFFVQSVVFLVIYYFIRFAVIKHPARLLHDLPSIFFYAFLGAGLAGFLLVPNYYYVLQNPRSSASFLGPVRLYELNHFMYMIKGMIMPGDIMWDETAFLKYHWASTSAHLPFVGFCFVFAYLLKKRDWLFFALIVFLGMGLFPQTNSVFLLFTTDYQRWWYGIVILAALASTRVLGDPDEYPIRIGVLIQGFILVILTAYVLTAVDLNYNGGGSALYHPIRYCFFLALMVPGMLCGWILGGKQRPAAMRKVILAGIAGMAMLTTTYNEYKYKTTRTLTEDEYILRMKVAQDLPAIEPEYRYKNFENPIVLFSNAANTNGCEQYTSTVSPALAELNKLFDFYAENLTVYKHVYAGLPEVLGTRYLMDTLLHYGESYPQSILDSGEDYMRFYSHGVAVSIKAYPACQMGYRVEYCITEKEWYKLPLEYRGIALLNGPCVKDVETADLLGLEQISAETVIDMIKQYPDYMQYDAILVSPLVQKLCDRNNAVHVKDFERDIHGFRCTTEYAENSTVFFSVPADEGWHIYIDGQQTDFTDAGGLLLIRVPAGMHEINAVYHCPMFHEGCIVSAVSAVGIVLLLVLRRKVLL